MERIEELLREMIAEVRRENTASRLPTVLSRKAAARELSISVKTLMRRISAGTIQVCEDGIPRSEIERLATPKTVAVRAPGAKRGPKPRSEKTAAHRAAAIRALTKRR